MAYVRPLGIEPNRSPLPLNQYLLRTVRVGVQTSGLTIACLIAYPFLSGHPSIAMGPYAGLLVAGALGVALVAALPWKRLFESAVGIRMLFGWSVLDIALISLGVAITGGGRSPLWLLYLLTTLFFSTSYPLRAQTGLLAITLGSYVAVLATTGWDVSPARLFLRLVILCLLTFLASFLARELLREIEGHDSARSLSERRAALLAKLHARLVTAQESERARVGRELHDELGQLLTSISLYLRRLQLDLPTDQAERIATVRSLAERAVSGTRALVWSLRPVELDELGLVPAIERLAADATDGHGVDVDLHCAGLEGRLPPETETNVYRIVQEAITNVIRHGEAQSLSIVLTRLGDELTAVIEDDGRGFDPEELAEVTSLGGGVGLAGMKERALAIGGRLAVESAPARGTTIRLRAPCATLIRRRTEAKAWSVGHD
jgi:signal transduction histidine kinase